MYTCFIAVIKYGYEIGYVWLKLRVRQRDRFTIIDTMNFLMVLFGFPLLLLVIVSSSTYFLVNQKFGITR